MINIVLKKIDEMGEEKPPFWVWLILSIILLFIVYIFKKY